MPSRETILDLGKLMIAVAWEDGEVSGQEINCLKDLLFNLPEVTGADWAELEVYMESPVGVEERDRLVEKVLTHVRSADDKAFVIRALTRLAACDGEVASEERRALEAIQKALDEHDTGILAQLKRSLGRMFNRSKADEGTSTGREGRVDDYVKNAIYFKLVAEMEAEGKKIALQDTEIRNLCLAAGLMARVAHVDEDVSPSEVDAMRDALTTHWGAGAREAELITRMSVSRTLKGLDPFRLNRGFFEATKREERQSFLVCLFHVANACGKTDHDEIETIRKIATGLKLEHQDFINAKRVIPQADRPGH